MSPRVLFLDHAGVLSGAELSLLDIAMRYSNSGKVLLFSDGPFRRRLKQLGIAAEVLPVSDTVSNIRREGLSVRELKATPEVLRLSWRVALLARDYDVLYANSQKAAVVSALAGKLAGKPVVWHLRDMLTADHFGRKQRWLVVALANRMIARVIANSKATAVAFVKSGGRAERVRVVYNGIDSTPFESIVPAEVDALKKELGLAGVPIVGVFSRLAPWKGQHVLLEALGQLPGVHVLLVGEALFGEYAYTASLGQRAEALGVAERVHFLGFREDVPRLMRLSDVVVHASVAPEPFGRMIVEGMLARRPVVASRDGGAVEIVEDGVNGILVPPGNSKALAGALSELLANPSKRHSLATAGYRSALKRFSLRAMILEIEQQILEVAAPRGDLAQTVSTRS